MCFVEEVFPSPKFVYAPFSKVNNATLVLPPQDETLASSVEGCSFDSLQDILVLSIIFTKLLTLSSQELWDDNMEAALSLALDVGVVPDVALMVIPFRSQTPSLYDQY